MDDSESARDALRALRRLAGASLIDRVHQSRIQEMPAAQALPANLTNADVGGVGVFFILISTRRVVGGKRAQHLRALLRQHFLKWDAVFFDVLVYSE